MSDNYPLRFSEAMAYVTLHRCFNRNDLASFIINIRTLQPLHRKNGGVCLYSGILFDNSIFLFQTFQDVISGSYRIKKVKE